MHSSEIAVAMSNIFKNLVRMKRKSVSELWHIKMQLK